MHVDVGIKGGDNMDSTKTFKENIIKIFNEAGFNCCLFHCILIKRYKSGSGLTIPRLELAVCHMFINLVDNGNKALTGYLINKLVVWTDSSTVLH